MENKKIEFTQEQKVEILAEILLDTAEFSQGLKPEKVKLCGDLASHICSAFCNEVFDAPDQKTCDELGDAAQDAAMEKARARHQAAMESMQQKEELISKLPKEVQDMVRKAVDDGAKVEIFESPLKREDTAESEESEDEADA